MELKDRRIAVTGATGFIGRYLVRVLQDRGAKVVAVVRNPDRVPALAEAGVELRKAELADRDALGRAFDGCAAVMSNAGLISVGEHGRDALVRVNLEGTRNVMNAVADAGVPRVVMTSSAAAYAPRRGHHYTEEHPLWEPDARAHRFAWYAVSKAAAEREAWRLADTHGIGLSTFRPHAVHGAFDDHGATAWLKRLTRGPLGLWLSAAKMPSIYAGDLAEGAVRMLERPVAVGRAYNLANRPGEHTFWDLLRAYREAGGSTSRLVVPLPVPIGRRYDITRAEQDLDFVNRPLVDGFRELLALEAAGGV